MSYTGNGFYNKRSGTWVSREHAIQHVGETVNGWEKRRSSLTGNFYMADASGSSGQFLGMVFPELAQLQMMDELCDVFDPKRAKAKKKLAKLAGSLSRTIAIEKEVNGLLDLRLGGHDDKRCYTEEGLRVMQDLELELSILKIELIPYSVSADSGIEDVLKFIKRQMLLGIDFNPQRTLSQAKEKTAALQKFGRKLEKKVASRTGYPLQHCFKPEVIACWNETFTKNGLPTVSWDEPYFWGSKGSKTYVAGRDIPVGEYYLQTIDERWGVSYEVESDYGAKRSSYIRGYGCYVFVEERQKLKVNNARFALAELLPAEPETSAGPGMWKVGVDLKPGRYTFDMTGALGCYSVAKSSGLDEKPELVFAEGGDVVSLSAGQYITLKDAEIRRIRKRRRKKKRNPEQKRSSTNSVGESR